MELNGIIEPKILLTSEINNNSLRVFLCHAQEDKFQVRKLHEKLIEHGMSPWLDEEELLPGMEWKSTIIQAISTTDVFVICLSRDSVQKTGFVQKEIRESLEIAELQPEGKIFILPIRFDECEVPSKLTKYQYLDFYNENALPRLVTTLNYINSNKQNHSLNSNARQSINLYLGFVDDITTIIEKSYSRNVILVAVWAESGSGERNAYREFLQIIQYIENAIISSGLYLAYTNPGKFIFVSSLAGNQLKKYFGVNDRGVYYISKGKLADYKKLPFAADPGEIIDTIAKVNF